MYVHQAPSPLLVALRAQLSLDAAPEAYHNPMAVWWGALAPSTVILMTGRLSDLPLMARHALSGREMWTSDQQ